MASATRGAVFQQIDRLYRDGTLAGLGDGPLLELYLTRGDEAAFEVLINVHGPMVLGLCRRMLRDPRDVEDAFQSTFLILVRKAPAIRDRGLLANWLYGVAFRVARRARAQTLRRRDHEITVENLEAPAASKPTEFLELGTVLDQELNRLPRKYRAPLILCYLKGRTHDQAAVELECPVGTVRSRLARGRDLLRRRISNRGHAPAPAFLGTDAALSARLLGEAVPPSLVSATVKAALAIGASKTMQAGAISASSLTLTQGVLTTMKIAQLKSIGLAVLATSLTAGGVVAVSYAARQGPADERTSEIAAVVRHDPQERAYGKATFKIAAPLGAPGGVDSTGSQEATTAGPAGAVYEKKLSALEQKLDQLLSRSSASASVATTKSDESPIVGTNPARAATVATGLVEPTHQSIRELGVELELAMANNARTQTLFEQAAISTHLREEARGRVLLIKAKLAGLDDDLADALALLELQIKRKNAEVERAIAQKSAAASDVTRNQRLNDRTPGMIGDTEVAKAAGELRTAEIQVSIKAIEREELALRARQLEQRRERLGQVIKVADQTPPAKPTGLPEPGTSPSPR